MPNKESFRISAALKNLIGKELITDEYVAVFELVKNSFDAYATNVEIIFENLYSKNELSKLIIKDNGKGMNYDDLKNKWLFVAYSAKTDGTEDTNYRKEKDYRDKIQESRVFAGAKGIGRFSCDRLGKKLNLISIKNESKTKIEKIFVDWEDFEKDQKKQFVNIKVEHEELNTSGYKNFNHGTILEIIELRDTWDRERLIKLKHSLEKLINPNQENDAQNFTINLIVNEEKQNDKEVEFERDKVNGTIKNFLFETLDVKTTQIFTEITNEGKFVETTLTDRGREIYKLVEKNPYLLESNIRIHLFQLNRAAKINFNKIMGITSVGYGSVFLYKNGFRVYPFGEVNEDILGIDRRKQQGFARFLGTRDLIGRIEINDSENVDNLKESTSRDRGLIKNIKSEELIDFFYNKALRRLEKYVVDLIKWGNPIYELDGKVLNPSDIKKDIIYMIANISRDTDVIKLDYDKNFLDILDEKADENLPKSLKNFESLADKTDDPEIQKEARKIIKKFKEHQEALDETKKELSSVEYKKEEAERELKIEKRKNQFLLTAAKDTTPEVLGLIHHVEMQTGEIYDKIDIAIKKIKSERFDYNKTLALLTELKLHSDKILKISRLITHSNFDAVNDEQNGDIVSFITEYCEFYTRQAKELNIPEKNLKIEIIGADQEFHRRFNAIDVSIVLDNLFSNSRKHDANKCLIDMRTINKDLNIIFSDDGKGINPKNEKHIFDLGFTTTKGSGIGLFYIKELLKRNNGTISFIGNNKSLRGANFELQFRK